MRKLIFLFSFFSIAFFAKSQIISSPVAVASDITNYTSPGIQNDSIFFICAGQLGTLTAVPGGGIPGWNFSWFSFVPATNSWTALTTQNGVATSTVNNLQPGGYLVTVVDGNGTTVSTDIAWICRVNSNPNVNVFPITPGCGNVQLIGLVNYGSITPYYNPPALPGNSQTLTINANTEITVCFNATHTFVSDLAFYLVGPASCGSPTILLSPNPGAIGQGTVCNAGDNIVNLCFSTESAAVLNVCTAIAPLTGTFGAYGPAATPINWAPLYGCDASQPGWTVQIYDCIGGDVGALTSASLTFTGLLSGGSNGTITYNSGNINSAIADNSCSAATASSYSVGSSAAVPISFSTGFMWTSNPPFTIPNASSALAITLNPGPAVDTEFTLTMTGNHPGAICGGVDDDTELYDYQPPVIATIEPVNGSYCADVAPFNLVATPNGGTFSGAGITDAVNGTFNPGLAGSGPHTITYSIAGNCTQPGTIVITVQPIVDPTIIDPGDICLTGGVITLSAITGGGVYSGTGITNGNLGYFDPMVSGLGTFTISYNIANSCNGYDEIVLNVTPEPTLTITPVQPVCISDAAFNLSASIAGGIWSGTGITNGSAGTFDPSVSGAGTFTINYQTSSSCPSFGSVDITVENLVSVTINQPPVLCDQGQAIVLTASQIGGTWSGTGITNSILGQFNPSISGVGTFTITYFINGVCDASDEVDIQVVASPVVVITNPGGICVTEAAMFLQASPAGGTWSGNGIVDGSTGLFDPSIAGAGIQTISYTVTGICSIVQTTQILVSPLPNVNAGNNASVCLGSSVNLNATGAATYSWSPSTGLSSTTIANPTASPIATITYTVTGTSAQGCQNVDQITVTVNPLPVVNVTTPVHICEGQSAQLLATGLANYSWTPTSGLTGANTGTPTASPGVSTVYTVSGTDANGCPASAQVTVNVTNINVNFTAIPVEGFQPLTVTFLNTSIGNSFSWDYGNGDSDFSNVSNQTTSTIYPDGGFFDATLTVTLDGCTESETVQILVYNVARLIVPNVITPNKDGKNDDFRVESQWMEELNIEIFNRDGALVGTIDKPDGSWKADDFSDGTYFFILHATGYDGTKFEEHGALTVLR